MSALFQSGQIVDLIVAFMVVETALLIGLAARLGHRMTPAQILANQAAGLALLLALRAALTEAPWTAVGGALALALLAHVWDVAQRWRG